MRKTGIMLAVLILIITGLYGDEIEIVETREEADLSELLQNGLPTVVDLGSQNCLPCKMMQPIFAALAEDYAARANVVLIDINQNREVAKEFGIKLIPTQIFFDATGKEIWRHEGYLAQEEIESRLVNLGAEK